MEQEQIASIKEQVFGQPPTHTPTPTNDVPESETPVVDTPTDLPPTDTPTDIPSDTPPADEVPANTVDYNAYVKENFGFDTVEDAKAKIAELKELKEKSPAIEYANEESKRVHELLLAGKVKEVKAIYDLQEKLETVESLTAADAIKLHIEQTNKHFKKADVEDVFEEKYALPEKPDEDDIDYDTNIIKYNTAVEKITRKIERDAVTAKDELAKLKSEIKLPEIQAESIADEAYLSFKKEQEDIAKMQEIDAVEYAKFTPKDIVTTFKFNDEAKKLAFEITVEPDKESFEQSVQEVSDLSKFFAHYTGKDGSPDRQGMLKDLYAGRNLDKIVTQAVNQAVNETMLQVVRNQKNIGDGVQRNFNVLQASEVDKLRETVFG